MRGFQSLDHRWGLSIGIQMAAELASARGDHRRAVWLAAASEALRRSVAAAQMPFMKDWLDETLTACRDALESADFTGSWRSGESTPAGEAIAAALSELDHPAERTANRRSEVGE
jgi:hypothetical protein